MEEITQQQHISDELPPEPLSSPPGRKGPVCLEWASNANSDCVAWVMEKVQGVSGLTLERVLVDGCSSTTVNIFADQDILACRNSSKSFGSLDEYLHNGTAILDILEDLGPCWPTETFVPGYPILKLHEGCQIVPLLLHERIISAVYLTHDQKKVRALDSSLRSSWIPTDTQIDLLREYFGDEVATYFAFLAFYTKALLLLVALCSVFYLLRHASANYLFAMLTILWSTFFMDFWKRRRNALDYRWGNFRTDRGDYAYSYYLEKPRPAFCGEPVLDDVTGRLVPGQTWTSNYYIRMLMCSYPLSFLLVGLTLFFFPCHNILAAWLGQVLSGHSLKVVRFLAKCGHVLIVLATNKAFCRTARQLTDYENHRTVSDYNFHLTLKLIMFYFGNNFLPLFLTAFYEQDLVALKEHLNMQLIINQVVQQVQEMMIPRVFSLVKSRPHSFKDMMHSAISTRQDDRSLEQFQGPFLDYLELFNQFGCVILFALVNPVGSLWALINNLVEIRTDAYKYLHMVQRPFQRTSNSMDVWMFAFQFLGILAVMTNCALIALSTEVRSLLLDFGIQGVVYILVFVLLEHIIFGIKFVCAALIPDVPSWILKELARKKLHHVKKGLIKED